MNTDNFVLNGTYRKTFQLIAFYICVCNKFTAYIKIPFNLGSWWIYADDSFYLIDKSFDLSYLISVINSIDPFTF